MQPPCVQTLDPLSFSKVSCVHKQILLDHIFSTSSDTTCCPSCRIPLVGSHFNRSNSLSLFKVKIDDPNITMEEYIRLEEEKARRRIFNDTLTSEATLSFEPTVSSLNNDEIEFTISFDESDDEDCTDLVKEKSTNIGGEFSNLEDLEVLES
ncbi:hypothetical protein Tco_0331246 [Tanacetum coccineum]